MWEVIMRRILALPPPENATETYVKKSDSPYPKYNGDKVVEYAGKRPTGYDSIKVPFEIAMVDELNPNANKPLGKWFMGAWLHICIITGKMYDWTEILDEIKEMARELKDSNARVNQKQDQSSYRMNKK